MVVDRVILDFDIGVDDATALLLLLHAHKTGKLKIEAIVATNGNTTVDNIINNANRLLQLQNVDIPIYCGVTEPLIKHEDASMEEHYFHGRDGFGDLEHDFVPDRRNVRDTPAVVAMGEIAQAHPGEVTIIAIGPLTNLALFLKLYGNVPLKEIAIMGGNYTGLGNATSSAEFNFYFDPEAARIVLEHAPCPVLILPWETCLTSKVTYEWRYNVCVNPNNKALALVQRAEKKVYKDRIFWAPCDGLLVACLLQRSMILDKIVVSASVETHGQQTRGQVIIDHMNRTNRPQNITIIKQFDSEQLKKLVMASI